jgi:hypothetical protein
LPSPLSSLTSYSCLLPSPLPPSSVTHHEPRLVVLVLVRWYAGWCWHRVTGSRGR